MKVVIDGVEYEPVKPKTVPFKVGDLVRVRLDSEIVAPRLCGAVAEVIGARPAALDTEGESRYELLFKESYQTAFDCDLEPYKEPA